MLALLGWWALILFDTVREQEPTFPAWLIMLCGLAYYCTLYNIFKSVWSNYRMKTINGALSAVGFLGTLVYQMIVLFGYKTDDKFLPYSIFFLNTNVLFLGTLVVLQKYENAKDVLKLLHAVFATGGEELAPDRETDLNEEIAE
jgi:hypothetical protein